VLKILAPAEKLFKTPHFVYGFLRSAIQRFHNLILQPIVCNAAVAPAVNFL